MSKNPILKRVDGLQFSVLGPDEIRDQSVVEVTKYETYDKNVPVVKGLFDLRMGTTDMGKKCNTCGLNNKGCPGHFGHIELARPVYHYHFIDMTVKILKCVCCSCGKLLVNRDHPKIQNLKNEDSKTRWKEMYDLSSKISRCGKETEDGCGCDQPARYKVDGIKGIVAIWKDGPTVVAEKRFYAEYVKTLFQKISDEDVVLLGFSTAWCRPEWLICEAVPVPPPAVRPSVKQGGDSQRMDDDLTHKLADIIKFNNGLQKKIESDSKKEIVDDWLDLVQYHVATLVDNELSGGINQATTRGGRPLKAIRQRLKGKEGRIRSNLMGKRVDFSARSVITPDPNIPLDGLGVPIKIALNLTYPEVVSDMNLERLRTYLRNGPLQWPGAKSVYKSKSDMRLNLNEKNRNDIELEIGDIIHRHLMDGDYVLFNRQPSLHKMSMMGHRIIVMKGNTFRLNVSATTPYNADFDGDEMNMHVPQSIEAVSELINIASVNKQIISPRENKPIISIVQDTLVGIYKLTKSEIIQYPQGSSMHYGSNTNLYQITNPEKTSSCVNSSIYNRTQMMNILCDLSTYNGSLPKPDHSITLNGEVVPMWSGHALLSYIIPDIVNLDMPNNSYDSTKTMNSDGLDPVKALIQKDNAKMNLVKILNGHIKQGTFDKNLFSKTSKGLIHTICNDLGNERAHDFINDLQKIVSYILLVEGFSVGISDMIADEATNQRIKSVIHDRKSEIEILMQEVHMDIFEKFPGQSKSDFFETKVNGLLNKTINETGKIGLANLDPKNRATYMVNSGSKGKLTNVAQMVACLGQQNVDGKRIPYGFTGRTLPHYYKYDDSSEARGFVENSFISGQTPQEFFFHAMGGREGLIDTAVKTATTGYVQRQLMKAMEDLMVGYDYSVRSSGGMVVQFVYGNDGMDGTYVESQPLLLTKMDASEIAEEFHYDPKTKWGSILRKGYATKVKSKKTQKALEEHYMRLLNHRDYLINVYFRGDSQNNVNFPVHIQRIIENVAKREDKERSDIVPLDILKGVETLKGSLMVREEFPNVHLFHILLDIHLSPKRLINRYRVSAQEFSEILEIIENQYNMSKISPGEMVGALAAQSIGEPATQMTLNTFHYAGVSANSKATRGIPRLKELLHVSRNPKAPCNYLYLNDDYKFNEQKVRFIKNHLEYTVFRDIVTSVGIYFDPKHSELHTDIKEDESLLKTYRAFERLLKEDAGDGGDVGAEDVGAEDVGAEDPNEDEVEESQETIPWIIRYTFNKEIMMDRGIIMEDVYMALMDYDVDKIKFVYTDDNAKQLVGRISVDIPRNEIVNGIQDQSDIISCLKNINEDILENIIIKGYDNINEVITNSKKVYDVDSDSYKEEYMFETDGINLLTLMNDPFLDETRCYSNEVYEVFETLGIEAARSVLISEINEVVEHAGEYINSRHIELLCDVMTSRGEIMSINRQGINSGDIGPLAKCSFEDTTDQLIKASIFAEKDRLEGVSSNIMMGQVIRSGTGLCDIYLDEEEFIKNIRAKDEVEEEGVELIANDQTIDELLDHEEDVGDGCDYQDFEFSFE